MIPRYIVSEDRCEHGCCFSFAILDTEETDLCGRHVRICEVGSGDYVYSIVDCLNAKDKKDKEVKDADAK